VRSLSETMVAEERTGHQVADDITRTDDATSIKSRTETTYQQGSPISCRSLLSHDKSTRQLQAAARGSPYLTAIRLDRGQASGWVEDRKVEVEYVRINLG